MSDKTLPSYDQLPVSKDAPAGSSWGVWGEGDVFGCLNLLTPERVLAATRHVRKGEVFALNWDMALPDPPLFERKHIEHLILASEGEGSFDDEINNFNTQSSSQWDGFRHCPSTDKQFYSGLSGPEHGVHHWARRGIVGRAVLVDIGRHRERQGTPLQMGETDPISVGEIRDALAAQGSHLEEGDILMLRTGWTGWYETLAQDRRAELAANLKTPGLLSCRETVSFLWDSHISALGTDVPGFEAWPPPVVRPAGQVPVGDYPEEDLPVLHLQVLPLLGLPVGEMWDLEALARRCEEDKVYEGLFVSAPLNLRSGTGSPPNAVLIR